MTRNTAGAMIRKLIQNVPFDREFFEFLQHAHGLAPLTAIALDGVDEHATLPAIDMESAALPTDSTVNGRSVGEIRRDLDSRAPSGVAEPDGRRRGVRADGR